MSEPDTTSSSGGVKIFSLQGRLYRERERLVGCGMTDAEREWRARWIRDQRLNDCEPRQVPEISQKLLNPIRRFYRIPMDAFQNALTPVLGLPTATVLRHILSKSAMLICGVYFAAYYFKYNSNDWTRKGGWHVLKSRHSVLPGEPGWPQSSARKVPSDYADRGFSRSPIQKPLTPTEREEPAVIETTKTLTETEKDKAA